MLRICIWLKGQKHGINLQRLILISWKDMYMYSCQHLSIFLYLLRFCSFPACLFLRVYLPQLRQHLCQALSLVDHRPTHCKAKVLPNLSLRDNFSLYLTGKLPAFRMDAMIYVVYTLILSLKDLHLDWGVPNDQISIGMQSLQPDFSTVENNSPPHCRHQAVRQLTWSRGWAAE